MLKFREDKIRKEIGAALKSRSVVEKMVDQVTRDGYSNLVLLGIGGTYASAMEMECYMRGHSDIPVYAVNAADLTSCGNRAVSRNSFILTTSVTGTTQEVLQAVEHVHQIGGKVFGFIDEKESPLAKSVDELISIGAPDYLELLLVATRLMKNRGEFPEYDLFWHEMDEHLPDAYIEIGKKADAKARDFALAHCDDELLYVIGAGNLWGAAYSYAMCYLEEMLWMRTKSLNAAEFFHGTLEVFVRDTNVLVFAGEDEARIQTDKVLNFLPRICANVNVFDTKDYTTPGITDSFRPILAPVLIEAVYDRINVHLEEARKHPMEIRRYYRRLAY